VIATNYFDQIDPAAKRIGRIDRVVGVGWPDKFQRERTISDTLAGNLPDTVINESETREAIDTLAEETHYFVRGELVELTNELASKMRSSTPGSMAPKQIVKDIMRDTLPSIRKQDREAFRRDAGERSACHTTGVGEMKPERADR
jgi:SpoVK/Ycf46/Vps4 family AAA+-type ATPase